MAGLFSLQLPDLSPAWPDPSARPMAHTVAGDQQPDLWVSSLAL